MYIAPEVASEADPDAIEIKPYEEVDPTREAVETEAVDPPEIDAIPDSKPAETKTDPLLSLFPPVTTTEPPDLNKLFGDPANNDISPGTFEEPDERLIEPDNPALDSPVAINIDPELAVLVPTVSIEIFPLDPVLL
jgi:hypothetical protein